MARFTFKSALFAAGLAAAYSSTALAADSMSTASTMLLQGEVPVQDVEVGPPDDFVTIDISGIVVGERGGKMHFLSSNGRYVFTGRMIDVWEQKEIRSVADVVATKDKVNLKNMGFVPENLNAFVIGAGNKKETTIFIDPLCDFCDGLIKQAKQIAGSSTEYQFNFVVIPALGERSHKLAKAFYCSEEPLGQKVDALTSRTLESLTQPATCNTEKYDLTLMAATAIGVSGVPFLIHPDGTPTAGTPSNFMYWLEGKK